MIVADSPTLWDIKAQTDRATVVGLLVLALIHTAKLVNVENNLNETQIGEIANDVLNDMGYLKMEEVKYILKTAVRTKKIFGRLDYNVVMEWFEEYSERRINECMEISDREAADAQAEKPSEGGISFEQYKAELKQRAANGDKEAAERLAEAETPIRIGNISVSREDRDKMKEELRSHRIEKFKQKHNNDSRTTK